MPKCGKNAESSVMTQLYVITPAFSRSQLASLRCHTSYISTPPSTSTPLIPTPDHPLTTLTTSVLEVRPTYHFPPSARGLNSLFVSSPLPPHSPIQVSHGLFIPHPPIILLFLPVCYPDHQRYKHEIQYYIKHVQQSRLANMNRCKPNQTIPH